MQMTAIRKALTKFFQRNYPTHNHACFSVVVLPLQQQKLKTLSTHLTPIQGGKDGLLDPTGTAVMMAFDHLKDLVCYIEKLFLVSLKLAPSHQFELVPINISKHESLLEACSDNTENIANTSSKESLENNASVQRQFESRVQKETNSFDASECMKSYFEDQRQRQKLFQEGRSDEAVLKKMNI